MCAVSTAVTIPPVLKYRPRVRRVLSNYLYRAELFAFVVSGKNTVKRVHGLRSSCMMTASHVTPLAFRTSAVHILPWVWWVR